MRNARETVVCGVRFQTRSLRLPCWRVSISDACRSRLFLSLCSVEPKTAAERTLPRTHHSGWDWRVSLCLYVLLPLSHTYCMYCFLYTVNNLTCSLCTWSIPHCGIVSVCKLWWGGAIMGLGTVTHRIICSNRNLCCFLNVWVAYVTCGVI